MVITVPLADAETRGSPSISVARAAAICVGVSDPVILTKR